MKHRMRDKTEHFFNDSIVTQIRGMTARIGTKVIDDDTKISILVDPNQRAIFKGSTVDRYITKFINQRRLLTTTDSKKARLQCSNIAFSVNQHVVKNDLDKMASAIIRDFREERETRGEIVEVVWLRGYEQVTADMVYAIWLRDRADRAIGDIMFEAKTAVTAYYGHYDTHDVSRGIELARETGKTTVLKRAMNELYGKSRQGALV